jgi:Rieske Fe-S protein
VLAGTGAAGLAALTAGCTTYGETAAPAPAPAAAPAGASGASAGPGPGSPAESGVPKAAPVALARASEIPVGGGKIVGDLVITQPTDGRFVAFSSTCTHQGCTVSSVEGGTINCSCHGSKFDVADGSVRGGPAPRPLPKRAVKTDGDAIVAA